MNKKNIDDESPYRNSNINGMEKNKEDSTEYGEFISSYFNWITLDEQKKRATELKNMTKNDENGRQ